MDIKGRVLYEGKKDSDTVIMASDRIEFKRAVETQLQERAQDLLERIVGPNAAVVKVSADVNMDMVKSVQDMYDPEIHVIRSEELKDQYARIESETQGAAGTTSNLPTGRGPKRSAPAAGNGSMRPQLRDRQKPDGAHPTWQCQKLTVSVVVDGTYKTDQEGNKMSWPGRHPNSRRSRTR